MKTSPFPIKKYQGLSFEDEFVEALQHTYVQILVRNVHADKAIRDTFSKQPNWKDGLRGWFAMITYDLIRWNRLLCVSAKSSQSKQVIETFFIHNHILLGLKSSKNEQKKVPVELKTDQLSRAEYLSLPDWLDEIGFNELGENWQTEIASMNNWPTQAIRCNSLKVNRDKLATLLNNEGIMTSQPESHPDALIIETRCNIFRSEHFLKGFFEVQDPSSQKVAEYLDLKPGLRVIDACAGTGGKSLHIACLMKNKGKLIAMDTAEWKLGVINKRAKRAGVNILETRTISGTKVIKRLKQSADRLLLDVPCSGLGVLRRNPDIRWNLDTEQLIELKKLQAKILDFYSQMVKPGGLLVYSSCSVLPSENEQQIQHFLTTEKGQNFTVLEQKTISPSATGFDGFFISKLERKK